MMKRMEHLTKQQLVLVALLVSFMTSIATGIITVSLMEQAPDPVTQTINRVVERTIETVVQAPATPNQQAAVVTKETIVVKSDDLVMQAVEKNTPHVIRIKTRPDWEGNQRTVALGLLISPDGLIVTGNDALGLWATSTTPLSAYEIVFSDMSTSTVSAQKINSKEGLVILKAGLPEGKKVSSASLGNSDALKLGQTVIVLSGRINNAVKSGIIASLPKKEVRDTTASTTPQVTTVLTSIETDLGGSDIIGSPIFNLSGDVIGIALGESGYSFTPINSIKSAIE